MIETNRTFYQALADFETQTSADVNCLSFKVSDILEVCAFSQTNLSDQKRLVIECFTNSGILSSLSMFYLKVFMKLASFPDF